MQRLFACMLCVMLMAGTLFAATTANAPGTWWTPTESVTEAQLTKILGTAPLAHWTMSGGATEKEGGPFSIQNDELLGQPVFVCGKQYLTMTSQTTYHDVEVRCLVRIVTSPEANSLPFYFRVIDPANPAKVTQVTLSGTYDNSTMSIGVGSASVGYVNQPYLLRTTATVQPTWPDSARIPLERDMNTLPFSQNKWVQMRYLMGKDRVRIWFDDRLVADKTDGSLLNAGTIQLMIWPGTRLADLTVHSIPTMPAGFEPVALNGYVRDRSLIQNAAVADDALPFGQLVSVKGVPLQFAQRAGKSAPDHLDIGRSLLREGSVEGYFGTWGPRYGGSFYVDPARIQLRIPNARYDAMYVVAAFNGEPNHIPLLSAIFYRPEAGFGMSFDSQVPAATAKVSATATPLPVKLENGKSANLWLVKIPIDPAKLTSFSDIEMLEVELTKQVKQYRAYPDPFTYGWHGGGLPSGVQVYAVTMHKPDVELSLAPSTFGDAWTAPNQPSYNVKVSNHTDQPRKVALNAVTTSNDKQEKSNQEKEVTVPANADLQVPFTFAPKKNGLHQLDVTMKDGAQSWTETRYFARLAPDTRAPEWKEGDGPMFGYWTYMGGHNTPVASLGRPVMEMAGSRERFDDKTVLNPWPISPQWDWAGADPVDQQKYDAYKETAIKELTSVKADKADSVYFFPEPAISRDLSTAGCPPEYYGDPPYKLNDQEKLSLRVHMNTAKAAAEAVRKAWPDKKIIIPWGDPLFSVAFLENGFPKNLIDGSGLDMIGFERLPEQQIHQMSTHRLYFLKDAYKKAGIENPQISYVEGIFSPTEPGALTWQEQADIYHRWSLISLAYGVDHFYSGWFAYDCGNYYGAEHYGGCGIQRRIPYSDPKPAYVHYATMTRMLERSKFDKWIPTGSNTVYCLKFIRPSWTQAGQTETVYALWTLNGTRPVTVTLTKDATVTVNDSMDNGTPVASANGKATFTVGSSPVYLLGAGDITAIDLGKPDHSDAVTAERNRNQDTWGTGPAVKKAPVSKELTIGNFGDGSWTLAHEHDLKYEENNYDTKRFLGNMSAKVTTDPDRQGNFLAVHLEKQDKERQTMPWYTVLKPKTALEIPGKACALGLWVKANSDWGRVVYVLNDAKGERWISTGTKDQWNCDDPRSVSSFNFDGWSYIRMEMPSNSEYDSFREFGSTWWGHTGGDGIVDLPLKLEKVIVERRTHVMYVNDIQPANPADVLLGGLTAEYETPFDATKQAVTLNQLRMPLPKVDALPNPIADMAKANTLEPVKLLKVTNPDWGFDGTTALVHFTETPAASLYTVWLSAYPDGRGAIKLPWTMTKSGGQIYWLRPAMKLYLWVTYTSKAEKDKPAQDSKPSNALEIEMVDAFSQK